MSDNQVETLTTPPERKPSVDQSNFDGPVSPEQGKVPSLSHTNLTIMLVMMCLVPMVTIGLLWNYLPPVFEGQLDASVEATGLPVADYYAIEYHLRPPHEGGTLIVENTGDDDWTHLINIQVNRHYQVYDTETLPAHSKREYKLDRFWNRTGAIFSLRYNKLKTVRIYARRPNNGRATFFHDFTKE